MHQFHTPYCTIQIRNVHIYEWCVVRYGTGALWDLWDWSIDETLYSAQLSCQSWWYNYWKSFLVEDIDACIWKVTCAYFCSELRIVRYGTGALHYNDVIMSTMTSKITSFTIVYSSVYSGADQRKHQSLASLAFVRGIHRWPVNSPHKGPVTREMFPFDDVIM